MLKGLWSFLILVISCIGWGEARADYNLTITGDSYSMTGTLYTSSNGPGPLTITGGTMTGTGLGDVGKSYRLLAVGEVCSIPYGDPKNIISIKPTQDNLLFPGFTSIIDGNGLAFISLDGTTYIRFHYNNSYSLWRTNLTYDDGLKVLTATLTPITAPASTSVPVMEGWWLLPGIVAGCGILMRRRKCLL